MKIDRTDKFAFYATNFADIGQLLKFDQEVKELYPICVWKRLQEAFADWMSGTFAGSAGWECDVEEDGPSKYFSFWNARHFDPETERGPYFCIELDDVVGHFTSGKGLNESACCYLWIDTTGGPASIKKAKLIATLQRSAPKLKAQAFKSFDPTEGAKDCFVLIDIGDLLHIRQYRNWEKNSAELKKRVENLARACMPLIDQAAR